MENKDNEFKMIYESMMDEIVSRIDILSEERIHYQEKNDEHMKSYCDGFLECLKLMKERYGKA